MRKTDLNRWWPILLILLLCPAGWGADAEEVTTESAPPRTVDGLSVELHPFNRFPRGNAPVPLAIRMQNQGTVLRSGHLVIEVTCGSFQP